MNLDPSPTHQYRAVSMELAAYLDEHCVELRVLTDRGDSIAITCPRDSIVAVKRHIDQLVDQCPEIATWQCQTGAPLEKQT